MPLADYTEYQNVLKTNRAAEFQTSAPLSTSSQRLNFASRVFVPAPATPTTSVALDRTSDHAVGSLPIAGSGRLSVLGASINTQGGSGAVILVDLLNVSGGLSGTVATEQTINLPTAALTRYTSGEGVMAGLCVWATVGTAAVNATVRYTNQAGTGSRTSTAVSFGGGDRHSGRVIALPLQSGDTGVRSVEGVTLSGTSGAAGNFGVCLFKPLAILAADNSHNANVFDAVSTGGFIGALAEVQPDACLSIFAITNVIMGVSGCITLGKV